MAGRLMADSGIDSWRNDQRPAPVLGLIEQAQRLNKWSMSGLFGNCAILIFGTLKACHGLEQSNGLYFVSLGALTDSVGLTIPLSCYVAFILYRYHV